MYSTCRGGSVEGRYDVYNPMCNEGETYCITARLWAWLKKGGIVMTTSRMGTPEREIIKEL